VNAAMALPPHMAVPAIKKRRFFIYFKTIPNKYPIDKVRTIDSIVNTSPFCPAFQRLHSLQSPVPQPEIWSSKCVALWFRGASMIMN
jgi:hypothetical protein